MTPSKHRIGGACSAGRNLFLGPEEELVVLDWEFEGASPRSSDIRDRIGATVGRGQSAGKV